jgi:hypothetical protein
LNFIRTESEESCTLPSLWIIIGNILGAISALLLALSVRTKNKQDMLYLQSADSFMGALGYLCLGGYNGAIVCTVAMIRNIIVAKNKNTLFISVLLMCATVFAGGANSILWEHTWTSLLPVIASAGYAAVLLTNNNYLACKIALSVHLLFFMAYGIVIHNYASAFVMMILMVNALHSIVGGINNSKKHNVTQESI